VLVSGTALAAGFSTPGTRRQGLPVAFALAADLPCCLFGLTDVPPDHRGVPELHDDPIAENSLDIERRRANGVPQILTHCPAESVS